MTQDALANNVIDAIAIEDIDAIPALLETDADEEARRKRLCDRVLRTTRYLKDNLGDLDISDERLLDLAISITQYYLH